MKGSDERDVIYLRYKMILKSEGIIYLSVKEEIGTVIEDERFFQYYNEDQLIGLIHTCYGLSVGAIYKIKGFREWGVVS